MLEMFKNNPRFLIGAIVVHIFFIALFGIGLHFKSKERASIATPKTVEVTTVDESLVKKELAKLKARDNREEKQRKNA